MLTQDYESLHPEYGGSARGFRCTVAVESQQCSKVTRTERGMKTHLLRVHNIKQQGVLFDDKAKPEHVERAAKRKRTEQPHL